MTPEAIPIIGPVTTLILRHSCYDETLTELVSSSASVAPSSDIHPTQK